MQKPDPKPNVLLVDDREEGLMALETVLENLDYNLVRAHSGREALTKLLEYNFAVVLMDVKMPEMNGYETATYIKKLEKTRNIPIIFVTGTERDERFLVHGYESGAVDYILKPFEPQILRSKVSVFVELFEQGRKLKEQSEKLAEAQSREQSRQLERLELESRMRYRNLADAIPHIVWKAGADLTVSYFNQTWTQYTGLSSEQSNGSGWKSAFHPDDLVLFMTAWQKGNEANENFELEARIYNEPLGEYRWHLIKAVAEFLGDGAVSSWLMTCTEIHALKVIESELIEAKKEADAANKAKSFFLANMSHEIRTPLGAIMGFSELLLQDDVNSQDAHAHASTIKRNGEQLLKIIDEILDISKIESGSLHLSKEKVYINDLVRNVESCLILQASKKNLKLNFALKKPVPEYFYSDLTRTRQILVNIIGNAVKFTSVGAIDVEIDYLPEHPNGPLMQFVVKDEGTGIDEKYIDVLFRPFSQGDSSTSRKYGGTGLGLALSRKLARALGGDLVLSETKSGIGSTFTITLACGLIKDVSKLESLEQRSVPNVIDARTGLIDRGLEGVKVLVADDALENQRLISWFLEKAGATVDIANDGEEAIAMAMAGDHDVILMDIQMPGVDGYQATQSLRRQGFAKPILAVTAHALIEERERCIEVGCTDHLSKPIDPRGLVESVTFHSRPH